MAFVTDYSTLVQSILDFSHRDDLRPYVDYFIQDATEAIQNDVFDQNEGAGLRFQEAAFAPTAIDGTTGTVPVPSDWLSPKLLTITSGQAQFLLLQKTAQWIYDRYPTRAPDGLPAYIARDGSSFIFGPYPDSTYTVQGTYYAAAVPISTVNPINWMTENCPLVLFSACMIGAAKFLKDDNMQGQWTNTYGQRIKAMIDADRSERWSNATMQIENG